MGKTLLGCVAIKSMSNLYKLKKKHCACIYPVVENMLHVQQGNSCLVLRSAIQLVPAAYYLLESTIVAIYLGFSFCMFIKVGRVISVVHIGYILIKGSPNQVVFEYFGVKI